MLDCYRPNPYRTRANSKKLFPLKTYLDRGCIFADTCGLVFLVIRSFKIVSRHVLLRSFDADRSVPVIQMLMYPQFRRLFCCWIVFPLMVCWFKWRSYGHLKKGHLKCSFTPISAKSRHMDVLDEHFPRHYFQNSYVPRVSVVLDD